jgi:hypothetical protein
LNAEEAGFPPNTTINIKGGGKSRKNRNNRNNRKNRKGSRKDRKCFCRK